MFMVMIREYIEAYILYLYRQHLKVLTMKGKGNFLFHIEIDTLKICAIAFPLPSFYF